MAVDLSPATRRVDGGQQLPVADLVGIDVVGIAVENTGADSSEMLVEEFDFFVQHAGAARSRFGERLRQPW